MIDRASDPLTGSIKYIPCRLAHSGHLELRVAKWQAPVGPFLREIVAVVRRLSLF